MREPQERDQRMVELRERGLTLQEIAAEVGLTRERVRQVLKTVGGPTAADVRQVQEARRNAAHQRLAKRIREDLASHPGSSQEEIAARLGIDKADVRSHVPDGMRGLIVNPSGSVEQVWSDDAVFEAIRHAATYTFPLTAKAYSRLVRSGEVRGPSLARVWQRFDSWTAACRAAGVEAGTPPRDNYQSKWTDEDIRDFVRRFLSDPEFRGTIAEYDPWRRARGIDAPSSGVLRHRLGRWTSIKREVLQA